MLWQSYICKDYFEHCVNMCSIEKSKDLRNKSNATSTDEFSVNTLAIKSCINYGAMNLEPADKSEIYLILQLEKCHSTRS